MISCRNVAGLLLSDQIAIQSWWKRMEIRMHLSMCDLCSRLARQLEQMRAAARQMGEPDETGPALEDRVIRRLAGK